MVVIKEVVVESAEHLWEGGGVAELDHAEGGDTRS